jgi:hypothetical protein
MLLNGFPQQISWPCPVGAAVADESAILYRRFATSRGKLVDYLRRSCASAMEGEGDPPLIAIVAESAGARLEYWTTRLYALSKARVLGGRGHGARRVQQSSTSAHRLRTIARRGDGCAARDGRVERRCGLRCSGDGSDLCERAGAAHQQTPESVSR